MGVGFESLIGESPELQSVLNAARVVAATDVTVLIQGESGTGKELLAQAIHGGSRRAGRNLVTINCAALPESLVESELFGHRKGAFTGATQDFPGKIRSAQGGTVFLDEIGELTLAVQAKLLRFLETGECQPVGAAGVVSTDVRIIAATNCDLAQLVQKGEFRKDLFYRLQVVPLELPPLRERRGDLVPLLRHSLRHFGNVHGQVLPKFDSSALQSLKSYHWPGNVRELRNLCERMVILLPGTTIGVSNLPRELLEEMQLQKGVATSADALSLVAMEKKMLRQALEQCAGNQSRAAKSLGLTRDTFLYRMRKYGIRYQAAEFAGGI